MPKLDSRFLATKLAAAVCLLAVSACATTTAGPTSVQEKAAMTESASRAINDSLNAQQLNDRVLAWLLSVNDARDLFGPNVEKRTGLDLGVAPETPGIFRGVGELPEGWGYTLSSVNDKPSQKLHAVRFQMGRISDSYADMTPVCVSLEHYRSALAAAGFEMSERPRRGGTEYRVFKNGKVSVRIELHGKTAALDEQLCVSKVYVTAAAPQG